MFVGMRKRFHSLHSLLHFLKIGFFYPDKAEEKFVEKNIDYAYIAPRKYTFF